MDRRTVTIFQRQAGLEAAIAFEVVGCEHCKNPRQRFRGGSVDRFDDAVSFTATHHDRVSLAWPRDDIGVAALASHQCRIFAAADRLADTKFSRSEEHTSELQSRF